MKPRFLKPAIFFGLIFGVIMIIEFLVLYKLDIDPLKYPYLGTIINLSNYLIMPVLFILLAVRTYKYKHNEGYISSSETLRTGAVVTIIAALTYSVFNLGFNYAFPEFIDETIVKMHNIALQQRENMLAQGATEEDVLSVEQIEQNLELTKQSMSSFFSIPMTVVMYAIVGIVASLVISAFVRREKPKQVS